MTPPPFFSILLPTRNRSEIVGDAIQVVRDDSEATVLRFEFEPGRVEWVVFNPDGRLLRVGSRETADSLVYLSDGTP